MFKPYDETTNGRLEKAYKLRKSTISLYENLGDGMKRTVEIDITNLTEKVGGRSVQIRRRDIAAGNSVDLLYCSFHHVNTM